MHRIKARATRFHALGGDARASCLIRVDWSAGEIFEAQKDRCCKDRNPAESHAKMETREHGRSGGCDKRFHIHAMLF